MPRRTFSIPGIALVLAVAVSLLMSCGQSAPTPLNAKMGETITLGGIEHTVLGAEWKTALGQGADARVPSQQFLLLKVAVSNRGDAPAEIAFMRLLSSNGEEIGELADGSGLPDWLGLVRVLSPRETRQGTVLFDAPRAVYSLKLTEHTIDGDDANVALVEIPIRLEDSAIPGAADPTATTLP